MEARRDTLTSYKVCRFCLAQGDTLTSIYEKRGTKNTVNLPLKILSCVSIEVFPSDKMPTYICTRCKFFIDISYDFKHLCRQADEHILQYIQKATPLPTLNWPQSLLKLFRLANKTPEVPLMKTVIEGGATVQVTAQESDTDEEDDENVYNVKIADGSDEGAKSARVKVITDKQEKGKPKRGKVSTSTGTGAHMVESDSRTELIRQMPESKFPQKQQLELQIEEYREPIEQKKKQDTIFFAGCNMNTYELTDNEKFNFHCIVCGKKFTHPKILKRHEKLNHGEFIQQPCPHCPATFLSTNQLEAHQKKHVNITEIFICYLCGKRFLKNYNLKRHIKKHTKFRSKHCCKYCPARFTSATKLSRHVQAHAEDRSYPCKYCNKSFVKSHHYTRHLRLKHRENIRTCRGPFGETDQYRCEQCEDSFATQDELIYHSAIHATQNLICPLCQEKFEDVDAVTAHIKSHVNGTEFMCDFCELVFTSKEKLDLHIGIAHDDELRGVPDILQYESSMEMDAEEDEEDGIDVKELDDHMMVELKKTNDFLLSQDDLEEKIDNTNSEESESEMTLPDIATLDPLPTSNKSSGKNTSEKIPAAILRGATLTKTITAPPEIVEKSEAQLSLTASILRKAEEVKKRVIQQPLPEPVAEKKNNKMENSNTVGASDKSLRLLEKELQELKRTNTRNETVKTPAKPLETLRSRRAQIHTSTPKTRAPVEDKKTLVAAKSPAVEKKLPERRVVTKENKESKEVKETKANNVSAKEEKEKEMKEREAKEKEKEAREKEKEAREKEKEAREKEKEAREKEKEAREKEKEAREKEKEAREKEKEAREKEKEVKEKEKEKEAKEKETAKASVKNNSISSEKSHPEEPVRRSTRPSKIKDYAKMIRDRSQDSDENDESDDDDDEEYKQTDKSVETKPKARRASIKTPAPKPTTSPATPMPRKRGRPRKDAAVAPKVRKEEIEDAEEDASEIEKEKKNKTTAAAEKGEDIQSTSEPMDLNTSTEANPVSTLVSPTGQTLKKIPIRALPPGVKPMPLPVSARPAIASGEVCEMQIGKKVVKVQKIVMTKAEVEAMTKKGLVEMKDGTMVLKQGIKLPSADSSGLRTGLVEDAGKESPSKKATPSRCDFGEDA